jgi:hypothetical protein
MKSRGPEFAPHPRQPLFKNVCIHIGTGKGLKPYNLTGLEPTIFDSGN